MGDVDNPIGRRVIFRGGPVEMRGLVAVLLYTESRPNAAGGVGYVAWLESEESGEEFAIPVSQFRDWAESL